MPRLALWAALLWSLVLVISGCGAKTTLSATTGDAGVVVIGDSSTSSGQPKPFTLLFRTPDPDGGVPTFTRLPVVDRHGRKIDDLTRMLPEILGTPSFEILEMTVGERIFSAPSTFAHIWLRQLSSRPRALLATQVLLRVKIELGEEGATFRLVGLDGHGAATFVLDLHDEQLDYQHYHLSPTGRYVLGRSRQSGERGVIVDRESGGVWREAVGTYDGVFAPDDSAFVYVSQAADGKTSLSLRSLPGGQQRRIELPESLGDDRDVSVDQATDDGFVIAFGSGSVYRRLWFLYRDGRWVRFHQDPEALVVERVVGLGESGELVFSRAPAVEGSQLAPGFYHFDPSAAPGAQVEELIVNAPPFTASPTSNDRLFSRYTGERFLFVRPAAQDVELVSWQVGAASPEVLGLIGETVDEPWLWTLGAISESGRVIVVGLEARTAALVAPPTAEGTIVFDERGERLFALPWGRTRVDRTGKLILHEVMDPNADTRGALILADVEAGVWARSEVSELSSAFVYR